MSEPMVDIFSEDNLPRSMRELNFRFERNMRTAGYGLGNIYSHVPCPFCGAADCRKYELLRTREEMTKDATCKECKRTHRVCAYYTYTGLSFEIVQTGGPDQPTWMEPKVRRVLNGT